MLVLASLNHILKFHKYAFLKLPYLNVGFPTFKRPLFTPGWRCQSCCRLIDVLLKGQHCCLETLHLQERGDANRRLRSDKFEFTNNISTFRIQLSQQLTFGTKYFNILQLINSAEFTEIINIMIKH